MVDPGRAYCALLDGSDTLGEGDDEKKMATGSKASLAVNLSLYP